MPPIEIRNEHSGDVSAIRRVNRLAFEQDQEANIIDALRTNGAVLLSLVATIDELVVGHAMYSPVDIGDVRGAGLGPLAVLPEHQRRGVGSTLIETGNQQLEDAGCPFIVVLGHADYYPRFGFRPARPLGITCEWDVPDDVFLALILDSARMQGVSGAAQYRPEFSSML
jgi:putative acetyltransferase